MENLLLLSTPAIVDIVAIAIVVLCAIIGLFKGFIKSLVSTFGTFVSILIAVALCGTVVTFLETQYGAVTFFTDNTTGFVNGLLGTTADMTVQEVTESTFIETGVTGWIAKLVLQLQGTAGLDPTLTVSQVVCPMFGYYIASIISIVGLFIVIRILLFIITEIILHHLVVGVLKHVDKVLGFLFGIVSGVIAVQIIVMIIGAIPLDFFNQLSTMINASQVTAFLMKVNIVQAILDANILSYVKNVFTGA